MRYYIRWSVVVLIMLIFTGCGNALPSPLRLTEFNLPTNYGQPQEIVLGPDGALWFTQKGNNQIGRITPTGKISSFTLPDHAVHPYGLVAGSDGALWFIGLGSQVGRITSNGRIQEFPVPLYDPPAIGLVDMASGTDGALWLLDLGNCAIRRITTDGTVTTFGFTDIHSPPCPPGLETIHDLHAIVAGPDGALWFTEQHSRKVGRITTAGIITEFPVPIEQGYPELIAAGPGNTIWFTTQGDHLEQILPDGTIKGFSLMGVPITEIPPTPTPEIPPPPLPGEPSGIRGLVAGADGALWVTLSSGHIERMTLQGKVTLFQLPNGSDASAITAGPGRTLWFTEPAHYKIGYITVGS